MNLIELGEAVDKARHAGENARLVGTARAELKTRRKKLDESIQAIRQLFNVVEGDVMEFRVHDHDQHVCWIEQRGAANELYFCWRFKSQSNEHRECALTDVLAGNPYESKLVQHKTP